MGKGLGRDGTTGGVAWTTERLVECNEPRRGEWQRSGIYLRTREIAA